MRYNKNVNDGYIISVGTGAGGTEIAHDEYDEILAALDARPTPAEGFGLRLRVDLTWEEYEIPHVEEPEPEAEPTTSEMLEAIKEGVNAI